MESQLAGFSDWQKIHLQGAEMPEEEFLIFEHCGRSPSICVGIENQAYQKWLAGSDGSYTEFKRGYAVHRRYLQHLQWQTGSHHKRWVLKMPFHLLGLDALFETYPDAQVVFMHRDPIQIMSSWLGLVKRVRQFVMANVDDLEIGKGQLTLMRHMMSSAMEFRKSRPDLADRFIDVSYNSLIGDVEGTIESLHHSLNLHHGWTDTYLQRVHTYLTENRERQNNYTGEHRVNLEQFGVDRPNMNEAFKDYLNCPILSTEIRKSIINDQNSLDPLSPFFVSPPLRVPRNT